jgi:3-deoxy-D-manno-octulosonic-acid transferase
VFWVLALPVLLLRKKTRPGLRARLGAVHAPASDGKTRVWVHAASAGDVKNVWPVVRGLKEARPGVFVIVSVVTNSGQDMANKMHPPPDAVTFLPLDMPVFVRRSLNAVRPDVLLLECTELWPALMREAGRRAIPMVLCNGRMSERSAGWYRLLFAVVGNPLHHLSSLCLVSDEDRDRYARLGSSPQKCHVTGNCKFDAAAGGPDAQKVQTFREALGNPERVIVAGSTHSGEETVVLRAFAVARKSHADLKLVWAPRYLEHADSLVARARLAGFVTARKSDGRHACCHADVIILDTMGELAVAYTMAEVALVGGSFVNRGGQNILEPAAAGVPVLHGPDMRLSKDQARALDGVGGWGVSAEELPGALVKLLDDRTAARRMGQEGRAVVHALAGSAARHVAVIAALLPGRGHSTQR